MGRCEVAPDLDPQSIRGFTKSLLDDLRALEQIIEQGLIESGVQRIGAEQEFFLVDQHWRPAPVATEMIDELEGSGFADRVTAARGETERGIVGL